MVSRNHLAFSRRDQVGSALLNGWEYFSLLSAMAGEEKRVR